MSKLKLDQKSFSLENTTFINTPLQLNKNQSLQNNKKTSKR